MSMKENPVVSVIMSVFNTPTEYLLEAVKSILNQTFQNFELLIVDDGSSEDLYTDEIFCNSKIRVARLPYNSGIPTVRNTALDIASGKYIAIMDSDDVALPKRLEKQVAFLEEHAGAVLCGTWFTFIGEKTEKLREQLMIMNIIELVYSLETHQPC